MFDSQIALQERYDRVPVMAIDANTIAQLFENELKALSDNRVREFIRDLAINPTAVMRDWDYGTVGQQYPCWTVLEHHPTNTGIGYCEEGFGPRSPWGLVFLTGEHLSIGMDAGWFTTFLQAFFDSQAATVLPIWRVFKKAQSGVREPISIEGTWEDTWKQVMALRESDPESRYDCDTSVTYFQE